jgi:glycosyltransferase involved in cell wall biosynthesis
MIGSVIPPASLDFDPFHPSNSVSVIIPVYNGAKFIAKTLETILAQTVPATEVIVINDGSPDNSASIVQGFGDAVTLINAQNAGAAASRNFGASKAKGTWLAFCDQDDLWLPTKLEKQLRLANEAPDVHFVLTDYAEIADGVVSNRSHLTYAPAGFWIPEPHRDGFVVRQPITGQLTTFQPSITSAPIVKRNFYLEVGGFDLEVEWGAEDTCFHFRCLSVVPFGVVPEVLMHYNRHPDAGSADPIKQMNKTLVVWDHILAKYPQAKPYREELLTGMAAMRKEMAMSIRYQRRQNIKRMFGLS